MMELLPSQLNVLYDLIEKNGHFSATQFTKTLNGDYIEFNKTSYYFKIYVDTGYVNSLVVNFSPGEKLYKEASSSIPWEQVVVYFGKWLKYLKREITSPDKWGRAFGELAYLGSATGSQYTHFTHSEYLNIVNKLDHIKKGLEQIPLTDEQNRGLKAQFDHLETKIDELNKFDWQSLFIGTVISVIIQLGVDKENANLLYDLIKLYFQGLILR